MLRLKTIDAHAAGEPLRLIVDGFPAPRGATMLDKREWVKRHADHLRRALMLEPRGHADMYGAILTEPVTPGSHAGVLFMHNEGYSTMCGHGVIAVTTIALERGLLMPGGDGATIVYDAPAGTIRARATLKTGAGRGKAGGADEAGGEVRVESVAFQNVPSFVLHGGLTVTLASRQIRADVAFGGAFYAIVDCEAVGLPIDIAHLPELRRVGMEIKHAIEACGTGTAAVMAVVDAMGLLASDRPFVHESLIGTQFTGRVASRTAVGEYQAIVPEISGSAWVTGEHTFVIDDTDPLKDGFRI
jgi:proline racemase